jgi:predicted hydrocarbon binding protein
LFKKKKGNEEFFWEELGDIVSGRPNLGQMVPVSTYRLLQYSVRHVLTKEFDREFADNILFKAGKIVGKKFCRDFLDTKLSFPDFFSQLKTVLMEQKIGILRIEKADLDNMEFLLTVAEDLDCSGLPFIDTTVCNFDEGFIAGIMKMYVGKEFSVKEIDCWGSGDRVCRFLVNHPK